MFRISYDYSDARFLERFYDHTMKGGLAKDVKRGFALGFKDALRHCGVKFAKRGFRILPANGDAEFPADEVKAEKAVEKAVKDSVKDEIRTRKEYARMKRDAEKVGKHIFDARFVTKCGNFITRKVSAYTFYGAYDEANRIVAKDETLTKVYNVVLAKGEKAPDMHDAYAEKKAGQSEVDALCELAKKAQKERKAEENRLRKIHGPNDVRLKCAKNDNFYIVRLQKWNGSKWRTDNDVAFMNVVDGLKWCRERGLVVREVVKPDGKVEVR